MKTKERIAAVLADPATSYKRKFWRQLNEVVDDDSELTDEQFNFLNRRVHNMYVVGISESGFEIALLAAVAYINSFR